MLERQLHGEEHILFLQRTQVPFISLMLCDTQLPVTPAPHDLMFFSGLYGYSTQIQRHNEK